MRDTHHLSSSNSQPARDRASRGGAFSRERWPTDPRIARFADDLRERLRHVCGDWEEVEFEALVQQIARMKLRWADLDRED